MNKNVFDLVSVTDDLVVLKVNSDDNLTVAMNPYISGDYDYISVTRGDVHVLTVIKKDGKTFDFHWGYGGHTLISDGLEILKRKVIDFIDDNKIMLECKGGKIREATICYNTWFEKWQLSTDRGNYWSKSARSLSDMIKEVNGMIGEREWHHAIAQTGIDVWNGDMRGVAACIC